MTTEGIKVMTDAEMLRELRQDIRDLNNKIDNHNKVNNDAHTDLLKQVAEIDKKSGVNAAKLSVYVVFITVFGAGLVNFGFHKLA